MAYPSTNVVEDHAPMDHASMFVFISATLITISTTAVPFIKYKIPFYAILMNLYLMIATRVVSW